MAEIWKSRSPGPLISALCRYRLREVVELPGLDALDVGVHLGAGEEPNAGPGVVAVAHGDPAIGEWRDLDASAGAVAEAAAWGIAFADHVEVIGVDGGVRLSVQTPERALISLGRCPHLTARVVWVNPDARTPVDAADRRFVGDISQR